MDSCAAPESQVANQMFTDRVAMSTLLIPGASVATSTAHRAIGAARALRTYVRGRSGRPASVAV